MHTETRVLAALLDASVKHTAPGDGEKTWRFYRDGYDLLFSVLAKTMKRLEAEGLVRIINRPHSLGQPEKVQITNFGKARAARNKLAPFPKTS